MGISLTQSELHGDAPALAERLWSEGYRPIEARHVEVGMTIVWFPIMRVSIGGLGIPMVEQTPHYAYVRAVRVDDLGSVHVTHTDGTTESDDGAEVWAKGGHAPVARRVTS